MLCDLLDELVDPQLEADVRGRGRGVALAGGGLCNQANIDRILLSLHSFFSQLTLYDDLYGVRQQRQRVADVSVEGVKQTRV